MSETAGSAGIISQAQMFTQNKNNNTMNDIQSTYRMRKIANQELRKNELENKGNLTIQESMELASLKAESVREKIAKLAASTVCYTA